LRENFKATPAQGFFGQENWAKFLCETARVIQLLSWWKSKHLMNHIGQLEFFKKIKN
jgi:hypothetical protein